MKTLAQRGIDVDLCQAFLHDYPGFPISKIDQVLAVTARALRGYGYWHRWLVRLDIGSYALFQGGYTSFTGWSYGGTLMPIIETFTIEHLFKRAMQHANEYCFYGYNETVFTQETADELAQQLVDGKALTYHELVARDFNRPNDIDDTYGFMLG